MTGESSSASSHIRVVARIRPISETEAKRGCQESIVSLRDLEPFPSERNGEPELIETKTVGGGKRWFELDTVFGKNSSQEEVYVQSGASHSVCQDIFKGYNATILAYGQTGSGKTHSMGTATRGGLDVSEEDGMIPRACVDLFRNVQEKCDGNARVELSYLEIYNEEIRDLLGNKEASHLRIRETLKGEVYVSGLASREVTSPLEVGQLMEEASSKRVVGSTSMNAVSSRSHAICTLRITGVVESPEQGEVDKFTSKLTLVDLAGSERLKKTGAEGSRRQEGININKGLFVLGQVVAALAESKKKGPARRPPYRESKLTRLLQDSLGGNSRTIMIACISPADFNLDESINTLRYATSARKIKSNATRNIIKNISQEEAAALRRENQLLKNQIAELQETINTLTEAGLEEEPTIQQEPTILEDEELDFAEPSSTDRKDNASHDNVTELQLEIAGLRKQLEKTQTGLRESVRSSAIELPAIKVQLELLREQAERADEMEEENIQLQQELDEAKADAESARVAAAKLSALSEEAPTEMHYFKNDEVLVVLAMMVLFALADQSIVGRSVTAILTLMFLRSIKSKYREKRQD